MKNTLRSRVASFFLLSLLATAGHALEPVNVTASADDGNAPLNTLNNNLSTRWSALGDGQWIAYELGAGVYQINAIELAFYKGDERTANFQIQVSSDANTWTTVWSGDQPISTTGLQSIPLDAQGRYIRIVGFGNSSNNWNSITEVEINDVIPINPGPDPDPTDGIIEPVSASVSTGGRPPENTLDNNLATR